MFKITTNSSFITNRLKKASTVEKNIKQAWLEQKSYLLELRPTKAYVSNKYHVDKYLLLNPASYQIVEFARLITKNPSEVLNALADERLVYESIYHILSDIQRLSMGYNNIKYANVRPIDTTTLDSIIGKVLSKQLEMYITSGEQLSKKALTLKVFFRLFLTKYLGTYGLLLFPDQAKLVAEATDLNYDLIPETLEDLQTVLTQAPLVTALNEVFEEARLEIAEGLQKLMLEEAYSVEKGQVRIKTVGNTMIQTLTTKIKAILLNIRNRIGSIKLDNSQLRTLLSLTAVKQLEHKLSFSDNAEVCRLMANFREALSKYSNLLKLIENLSTNYNITKMLISENMYENILPTLQGLFGTHTIINMDLDRSASRIFHYLHDDNVMFQEKEIRDCLSDIDLQVIGDILKTPTLFFVSRKIAFADSTLSYTAYQNLSALENRFVDNDALKKAMGKQPQYYSEIMKEVNTEDGMVDLVERCHNAMINIVNEELNYVSAELSSLPSPKYKLINIGVSNYELELIALLFSEGLIINLANMLTTSYNSLGLGQLKDEYLSQLTTYYKLKVNKSLAGILESKDYLDHLDQGYLDFGLSADILEILSHKAMENMAMKANVKMLSSSDTWIVLNNSRDELVHDTMFDTKLAIKHTEKCLVMPNSLRYNVDLNASDIINIEEPITYKLRYDQMYNHQITNFKARVIKPNMRYKLANKQMWTLIAFSRILVLEALSDVSVELLESPFRIITEDIANLQLTVKTMPSFVSFLDNFMSVIKSRGLDYTTVQRYKFTHSGGFEIEDIDCNDQTQIQDFNDNKYLKISTDLMKDYLKNQDDISMKIIKDSIGGYVRRLTQTGFRIDYRCRFTSSLLMDSRFIEAIDTLKFSPKFSVSKHVKYYRQLTLLNQKKDRSLPMLHLNKRLLNIILTDILGWLYYPSSMLRDIGSGSLAKVHAKLIQNSLIVYMTQNEDFINQFSQLTLNEETFNDFMKRFVVDTKSDSCDNFSLVTLDNQRYQTLMSNWIKLLHNYSFLLPVGVLSEASGVSIAKTRASEDLMNQLNLSGAKEEALSETHGVDLK